MPIYSDRSKGKLKTCDKRLQLIFNKAIKHFDHTILFGHRDYTDQTKAFNEGKSKLSWPDSKHNKFPSLGIDAAPYPIPEKWGAISWDILTKGVKKDNIEIIKHQIKELHKFYYFAGYILGIANGLDIRLRCGADWNGDKNFNDQTFDDLCHFELIDNW